LSVTHRFMAAAPVPRAMRRAANPWDRFYRHHEAPWRGERPVAELLPLLGTGPVLELGSGNGKLLRPLLAAGVAAVALDLSWHALSRLDAPRRVLADASRLPFRDGAFSAVLDVHCTGHLLAEGRARAAREAWRVLRPGGVLVVERLTPEDLRAGQGQDGGEPGTRALADGRTTHFSTSAELAAEMEAAGFEPVAAAVERHHPGHRGNLVTRESVRAVFRKPSGGAVPGG
jgi:SAM-dependent methyltransferase